jgi:UDP-4-amino-4,6-dideoxy-N-acetyl-beta-L-altrosamine N-acetyltransferase
MMVGERVRLRAIEAEDLPLMARWRNDPQVYRCFFEHEPISMEMQRRWYQRLLERGDEEKCWIAELIDGGGVIGMVGLSRIDGRNRSAELGRVLVAPGEHRGKGLGKEICRLAIEYAFGHLNLHRLYLYVFAENEAAIRTYRGLGFVEEGRMREHVFAEGGYRDVVVMGVMAGEFRSR